MPNPTSPEDQSQNTNENEQSFGELLSQYERAHSHKPQEGSKQLEGTVVSVGDESVFLDIGYKIEGVLPLSAFGNEAPKRGDKVPVSIKGRNAEGYYELTRFKVQQPTDWSALEQAFNSKAAIVGTVTAVVKGGASVDVGVRAFMPASRSGTRDAAELEKLVGQDIRCRIIKLDVGDEDVVVDRRAVLEEEERATKERRYAEIKEGDVVTGTVRSVTDYGAFVDIGGLDGLLHIGDMSWGRVKKVEDVLSVGQQIEVRVQKIDREKQRISLSLKQLQADPWESAAAKYTAGERIRGTVTRVVDFGAFVELEPGIEGLIHLSEMSWTRKVRKPNDMVTPGDTVDAVVLGVNPTERRISLGLKQALGDPWADVAQRFPAGSVVEGTVTNFAKFGAFVQVAEGVEGMIHVSEISAEKRIERPQDVLKVGQTVQAQVLSIDPEKRAMRLSMKQLVPTGLDEFLAEHKAGDVVTGRVVETSGDTARVELGEGVLATARLTPSAATTESSTGSSQKADLSSLSNMLQARWKGSAPSSQAGPEPVRAGQVRSFKITKLDASSKHIEVELR